MNQKLIGLLAVAVSAVATLPAQAAAIDVTSVTGDITANLTPIAAIGAAVLGVFVALKAFYWVRRALS